MLGLLAVTFLLQLIKLQSYYHAMELGVIFTQCGQVVLYYALQINASMIGFNDTLS